MKFDQHTSPINVQVRLRRIIREAGEALTHQSFLTGLPAYTLNFSDIFQGDAVFAKEATVNDEMPFEAFWRENRLPWTLNDRWFGCAQECSQWNCGTPITDAANVFPVLDGCLRVVKTCAKS